MKTKICKKCEFEKDINSFYKGKNICKDCWKSLSKSYYNENKDTLNIKHKNYYNENKEKIKKYNRKWNIENVDKKKNSSNVWYVNNKEKHIKNSKIHQKKWFEKNKEYYKEYNKEYNKENKEKIKKYNKKYYEENKENINLHIKERRLNDPIYKLSCNIRSSLRYAFKKAGYTKNSLTENIIGCSFEYLLEHIQKQFQPWMTWDNHGLYNGKFEYGWDIDHIEPLFPEGIKRSPEDIIRLNHYTNLQPLCSKINRDIKRNKSDCILF
jgi:hypothetical protein